MGSYNDGELTECRERPKANLYLHMSYELWILSYEIARASYLVDIPRTV